MKTQRAVYYYYSSGWMLLTVQRMVIKALYYIQINKKGIYNVNIYRWTQVQINKTDVCLFNIRIRKIFLKGIWHDSHFGDSIPTRLLATKGSRKPVRAQWAAPGWGTSDGVKSRRRVTSHCKDYWTKKHKDCGWQHWKTVPMVYPSLVGEEMAKKGIFGSVVT